MNARDIARTLNTLPQETDVEKVDLNRGTVEIHYSGISKPAVERAGWNHVRSTDYYGVARRQAVPDGFGELGGLNL